MHTLWELYFQFRQVQMPYLCLASAGSIWCHEAGTLQCPSECWCELWDREGHFQCNQLYTLMQNDRRRCPLSPGRWQRSYSTQQMSQHFTVSKWMLVWAVRSGGSFPAQPIVNFDAKWSQKMPAFSWEMAKVWPFFCNVGIQECHPFPCILFPAHHQSLGLVVPEGSRAFGLWKCLFASFSTFW